MCLSTCTSNHSPQALTGTPTCYIFACPQDIEPLPMDTALHALVPYGQTREPGLLLLSPGGILHFWDSLAMGLAGGEPSERSSLTLSSDERVTTLTRADVRIFRMSFVNESNITSVTPAANVRRVNDHRPSLPSGAHWFERKVLSDSTRIQPSDINALPLSSPPRLSLLA